MKQETRKATIPASAIVTSYLPYEDIKLVCRWMESEEYADTYPRILPELASVIATADANSSNRERSVYFVISGANWQRIFEAVAMARLWKLTKDWIKQNPPKPEPEPEYPDIVEAPVNELDREMEALADVMPMREKA